MERRKLSADQLVKIYRGRQAVKGVSLEVEQGSIVGLLGPNGAGKTTTFYMIAGVVRPDRGAIYLDEAEITHYPMHKRARCGIGYLSQERSIFRKLTVEDNQGQQQGTLTLEDVTLEDWNAMDQNNILLYTV